MPFFPIDAPMATALRAGKVRGIHLGIVAANKDGADNPGYRVRVRIPTLAPEEMTWWARIAVPMAGNDRGTYFLPEIDDQVLLVFEHGDINRPIVIGSVWSKTQPPAETNGTGKNNAKVIKSRSGHRIVFDDTKGAEKISIVDSTKGNKIVFDTAAKKVTIESKADILVKAKGNVIVHGNTLVMGASSTIEMKGKQILAHAGSTFGVKADGTITIKGSQTTMNVSSSPATSVGGSGTGEIAGVDGGDAAGEQQVAETATATASTAAGDTFAAGSPALAAEATPSASGDDPLGADKLVVNDEKPPLWLTVHPMQAHKGDAVTLTWGNANGATLQLANGFGSWDVTGKSSVNDWHVVSNGTTQVFTLIASDGRSASCSVKVLTGMWIKSVPEARKGDMVTVQWGGAPGGTLMLANGFGSWEVTGKTEVDDWHIVADTTQIFTLTAVDGSTASCSVKVLPGLWLKCSVPEARKGDAVTLTWGNVPVGTKKLMLANGFGSWDVTGKTEVDDWHIVANRGAVQEFTLTADGLTSAKATVKVKKLTRDLVWCVWYDWWDKGFNRSDHEGAAGGVATAFVDPAMKKQFIWLYEKGGVAHFNTKHPDLDRVLAVVLLGSFPWWETWPTSKLPELNALKKFITTTDLPIVGFCGGHQLVAKAFTGDKEQVEGQSPSTRHVAHCYPSLDTLIDARPSIIGDDNAPTSGDLEAHETVEKNFQQENGRPQPMILTAAGKTDPIFEGMTASPPWFLLWHHDWVRAPSPAFDELASSDFKVVPVGGTIALDVGRNQVLKHKSKPIYTSQFHPEQDYKGEAQGKTSGTKYLKNFFEIAIKHWGL